MTINWDDVSGLRPDADTCYDDAQEFYEILMQGEPIRWEWLDGDREQAINQAMACKSRWYSHVQGDDGDTPYMSLDEAVAEVDAARDLRRVAERLEKHLQDAVAAYDDGDLKTCVAELRYAANVESEYGDDTSTTDLACQLLYVGPWTLEIMDDDGVSTAEEFDEQPSEADIREACESSVEGGDWGSEGWRVSIRWTLTDPDGDDVDSGTVDIDIPPDHEALIEEAIKYDSDVQARCCGLDPDDHNWTNEGEGGCDSNPGVWATGGTSMRFAHHCRNCGLRRVGHTTGSQCNPGDHDTVEYDMPDQWCDNCESDDHNTADCEK